MIRRVLRYRRFFRPILRILFDSEEWEEKEEDGEGWSDKIKEASPS